MRVLVTGAYGLIGSAILARLHRDGHELVAAGRSLDEARRRFPYATWIAADFTRLTTAGAWRPLLANVDAVVNCVGVLQDGGRDDIWAVQVEGTCALFDACVAAGVRRVVHISAVGASNEGPTAFARTKAQADAHLASLDLDWVILRPSLVLAPAAYGGSAMLRGLAGLPWVTPSVAGEVQVVSSDDVADTVALCLRADAPTKAVWAKSTWELTHPTTHDLGDVVAALRAWHGFPPRPRLRLPAVAFGVIAMFAEFAGRLGWRSPARATALAQLSAGVVGDPSSWVAATGIKPRSLDTILADRPASVQDRWFARLYWLKPAAILALAAFWIMTGVIALGPGRAAGMSYLSKAGLGANAAEFWLIAGSLLDIAIGLAVLVRRFTRRALQLMLIVSAGYLLIGTIAAPEVWSDPLGPYVKIIPVLMAIVFTLAILDER
ncbi:MAG TPA: SDR family oxidoreductase [Xanthobacteraceae bacterium]|nr:SDR family oxidoreductase [Xanthobacteraceae bacterium]